MKVVNEESVTFYLENAALDINFDSYQKPGGTLAWDIYFEFKTGIGKSTGTLFHGYSKFDEIVISISNGIEIVVELNSQKVLTFESLTPLDDNQWHSVLFEYNIMDISLYVDKKNSTKTSRTYFFSPVFLAIGVKASTALGTVLGTYGFIRVLQVS